MFQLAKLQILRYSSRTTYEFIENEWHFGPFCFRKWRGIATKWLEAAASGRGLGDALPVAAKWCEYLSVECVYHEVPRMDTKPCGGADCCEECLVGAVSQPPACVAFFREGPRRAAKPCGGISREGPIGPRRTAKPCGSRLSSVEKSHLQFLRFAFGVCFDSSASFSMHRGEKVPDFLQILPRCCKNSTAVP